MKGKQQWVRFLVLGCLAPGLVGFLVYIIADHLTADPPQSSTQATRTVIQRYELKNHTNQLQKEVDFWVHGLLADSSTNRLQKMTSNREYQLQKDAFGNQIMAFRIDQIAPYGSVIVENKGYFSTPDEPMQDRPVPIEAYLRAEHLIESADPRIVQLAASFLQDNNEQRARAIYDWVVTHIQLSAYQSRPQGALKTLLDGRGDCTEFAHLYTAIARATDLPSRVMAGYRYTGSALMQADDQHNWSEVFLNGQWRTVDPHARQFLENEANYIATMCVNMRADGPLRGHQRFQVSSNAVRVQQF